MNAAGLYEAGIDGGGLFREFTNEVLKAAFDPNRGFFKLTRDQNLYPNPNVDQIHENYVPHYYFIGRMLGKVRGVFILRKGVWGFFEPPTYVRSFSLHKVRGNCHFLDHPPLCPYVV